MFKGSVYDLTELLTKPRVKGGVFFVMHPAVNEPGAPYLFDDESDLPPLGTIVVGEGPGQWIKQSNLIHTASTKPLDLPPLVGVEWLATLTNPTRIVRYRSVGITQVSDWVPFGNSVLYSTTPMNWVPDYPGQQVIYNNSFFVALNNVSANDWGTVYVTTGS